MSQNSQPVKRHKLLKAKELTSFCRQMSMISRSDITFLEGVALVADQATSAEVKKTMEAIHAQMETGLSFGKAFVTHGDIFPTYLVNMVELGESSGNLDNIFAQMADYYDKESRFQAKIRTATTYPAILLVLMILVIVLLVTKVLPTFEDLLISMGGELPLITKVMLGFGMGISKIILPLIIVVLIAALLLYRYFNGINGRRAWDKFKLSAPFLSRLNQFIVTTRFARSMAILIRSGSSLLTSLETAAGLLGNAFVEHTIKENLANFGEPGGPTLSQVLEKTSVFPSIFLRMTLIGEKTGNLDVMMEKSAQSFNDETDDQLDKLSTTLEPALIIILSVIVAIILLSVMLPMIQIISSIA